MWPTGTIDESAVADGSSALTGMSSTAAGNTSAAADTEPAGTESAGDTGAAGRSFVAVSDASPAATTPNGANLSTPDITGPRILADITAKHIVHSADITVG